MSSSISYLDKIDKNIISIIQNNPEITYTEIADKVGRSQPAIGKRIKKLENKGILSYQAGLSIKNSDFMYILLKIRTSNPERILRIAKKCPYMPVAFKITGKNNINIIVYGPDLKFLNKLINRHFKGDKKVNSIKFDVILDINENIVLPIDFSFQKCEYINDI